MLSGGIRYCRSMIASMRYSQPSRIRRGMGPRHVAPWSDEAEEEFWLPLPPVVRDAALGSMVGWRQLVINESTPRPETQ